MCKRTSFVAVIVLFGMVIAVQGCAPATFERAQRYEQAGQYKQALQVYERIPITKPGTDEALKAQKQIVMIYIIQDKESETENAFKNLVGAFSMHEAIAQTIHSMAYSCQKIKKYKNAKELYEYVVSHWPEHDYAMRSQMDLVKLYLTMENKSTAETAVDKLLADFSRNKDIAQSVHNVAYHYQKFGNYDKAKELYQYVLSHWPEHDYAMWSQMDLAKLYLLLGNNEEAETAIDKLITDFSQNEDLAKALHNVAYSCQNLKKYEKAEELYEYVLSHWPEHDYAMWSQMDLAKLHLLLGNNAVAETAIDKLITDFSQNEDLAKALHNVAYSCQNLKKYEMAKELYQYVLSHWPKHTYAMWSRMDLAKLEIRLGNDAAGRAALNKLTTDFRKHPALYRT